jgi:hypothetical protein
MDGADPRFLAIRKWERSVSHRFSRKSAIVVPPVVSPSLTRNYSDCENRTISSTEIFLGVALMVISASLVSGMPRLSAEAVAVTRTAAVSRAPM